MCKQHGKWMFLSLIFSDHRRDKSRPHREVIGKLRTFRPRTVGETSEVDYTEKSEVSEAARFYAFESLL